MRRLDVLILTSRRRPERGRCDALPICRKRFSRRPIVLTWHRNHLASINGTMLACNFPIACSRSTCHRKLAMCYLKFQSFFNVFRRLGSSTRDFSS